MTFGRILNEAMVNARRNVNSSDQMIQGRRAINLSLQEVQAFSRWQCLEENGTVTTGSPPAAGTAYYDVPSDFDALKTRTMGYADVPLEFDSIDHIHELDPDYSEVGTPERFGLVGGQFFFHPRIGATFAASYTTIPYVYYKNAQPLAESGTASATEYGDTDSPCFPVSFHNAITLGALYRLLRFVGVQGWTSIKQEMERELDKLVGHGQIAGDPRTVGDGGFGYLVGVR